MTTEKPIIDFSDFKRVIDELTEKSSAKTEEKRKKSVNNNPSETIRLTKDQFVFLINFIIKFNDDMNETEETLQTIFDPEFTTRPVLKVGSMMYELESWIADQMMDFDANYGTTLSWWLWEAREQHDDAKWIGLASGENLILRTPEDLYDALVKIHQEEVKIK